MYRGRYFIRESVYVCGDYMDADIYPVFQPAGKRRARCKPTSAIQEKLNQKNAEKKITRLAHANFTEDDIALHLTYDELPEDEEPGPARPVQLHPPGEAPAQEDGPPAAEVSLLHRGGQEERAHPPSHHHVRRG